jgi:Histidine kinase-, DNA gyrase B-, and HSP90-like ATPase
MPVTNHDHGTRRVVAVPAKRFFVAMLVKDIELAPAIIDLVDNSVDGGKRLRPRPEPRRYEGLRVSVTVSSDRFVIEDNCGGIDLDSARDYAFRFGRPEDVEGPLGEVGQFGVGMKRALFKIGRRLLIESRTTRNTFRLPVDVDAWLADDAPNWSFELQEFDDQAGVDESAAGTTITVDSLYEAVAKEMGSERFPNRLREELRMRQARVISQGMEIVVNGAPVEPFEPTLQRGDRFTPISLHERIPVDGTHLDMRLYAGLVLLSEREGGVDDETAEDFRQPPEAGWYLYCNDRLLLRADRSRLTGWGEVAAAYHPQYRQFRGYVLLEGDAKWMPWTTTKTAVDEDSAVFRAVQLRMFHALQKVQSVMNRLKKETQTGREDLRPGVDALHAARPVPLEQLRESAAFVLPDPALRSQRATEKWIRYTVDPDDFQKVATDLGVSAAADVGRHTFRHYLDTQVDA